MYCLNILSYLLVTIRRNYCFRISMIEKIRRRMPSWRNHNLSMGDHLFLLQVVLFALSVYFLSFFKALTGTISKIESLFKSFLWVIRRPVRFIGSTEIWFVMSVSKVSFVCVICMCSMWLFWVNGGGDLKQTQVDYGLRSFLLSMVIVIEWWRHFSWFVMVEGY